MNRRLQQFLAAENISQSQFADTIGVARASVSHILAGRNKPGFDFILSMARHYPSLNLEWLITGKGKMYGRSQEAASLFTDNSDTEKDMPEIVEMPQFEEPEIISSPALRRPQKPEMQPEPEESPRDRHEREGEKGRNIVRIVVFYDDNSYQELK